MAIFKSDDDEENIDSGYLELMKSEYHLIQEKIDRIGDFKFKVRGWLITVYSAFLYAILTENIPGEYCFPLGFTIVVIFHVLEREQIETQHRLSNRVKLLERAIFLPIQKESLPKEKFKAIMASILSKVESSPRIGVILTARSQSILDFVKSIFMLRVANWLFIFLHTVTALFATLLYFECLPQNLASRDEMTYGLRITNNIDNSEEKTTNMRANVTIEAVEREMFSLVSQIDFGDISEIDAYWESLALALRELEVNGWLRPTAQSTVGEIIRESKLEESRELAKLADEMEELCKAAGSSSSVSDDDMKKLKKKAEEFEKGFEFFLDQLDEMAN